MKKAGGVKNILSFCYYITAKAFAGVYLNDDELSCNTVAFIPPLFVAHMLHNYQSYFLTSIPFCRKPLYLKWISLLFVYFFMRLVLASYLLI